MGPEDEPDNSAVERLIAQASDRPSRLAALQALADAVVLVPGHTGRWGDRDPQPFSMQGPEGEVYPVFTSRRLMDPFLSSIPEPRPVYAEQWIRLRDYMRIALSHDMKLVFNPLTRLSGEIPAEQMDDLLAGRQPGTSEYLTSGEERMRLSDPDQPPSGLVEALRNLLAAKPSVKEAHLRWMQRDNGLQGYLLVLVSDGPREEAVSGLRELDPYRLAGGRMVEVIVRRPGEELGALASPHPVWPPPGQGGTRGT